MTIDQGDIFWVAFGGLDAGKAGNPHLQVVIQGNVLNHSRIHTVVVCTLTYKLTRANLPGSVLLETGEGNLPMQIVAEVSKLTTVEKSQLGDTIGSLSQHRVEQILAGMRFLQRMTAHRPI